MRARKSASVANEKGGTSAKVRIGRDAVPAQVFYGGGLLLFAALAALAHLYAHFAWDVAIARFIQSFDQPWILALMRAVSIFGDGWVPYVLTALTALALLFFGLKREAGALLLCVGGGALLNDLLKLLVARPRPAADLIKVFGTLDSKSFPSGHVMFYVSYFGFLLFLGYAFLPRNALARRLALLGAALLIMLIGPSRIYLGAHWPSDVLGAYLIGGLWLGFTLNLHRRHKEAAAKLLA